MSNNVLLYAFLVNSLGWNLKANKPKYDKNGLLLTTYSCDYSKCFLIQNYIEVEEENKTGLPVLSTTSSPYRKGNET